MTTDPFNLTARGMAVFFATAGVFIIVEALTGSHFANEEGGIASPEQRERYRATPKRRAAFVALGLVCIVIGIIAFIR